MLLKPYETDDDMCSIEITNVSNVSTPVHNNNNIIQQPQPKIEEIVIQPLTIRQRISRAMDLQLLKDPIFVSIAVGLALAYTASINFSMLFPYFLQVNIFIAFCLQSLKFHEKRIWGSSKIKCSIMGNNSKKS